MGCRVDRSREWALRCMHELRSHKQSCFVTLTYDEEHLPESGSLNYEHFQLFMRYLRRIHPVRFFMCGEYGSLRGRPHYHAILFGYDFPDKRLWKTKSDTKLYRSATLERLWPHGHSSIGDVTYESAAYVARYCLKKTTGAFAEFVYTDPETGEIFTPEFARMSLKPGIGRTWLDTHGATDVFPHDNIIYKGSKYSVPRYYDKLWEQRSPDDFESIKFQRELDALTRTHESTPERLKVREEVFLANLKKLSRKLK